MGEIKKERIAKIFEKTTCEKFAFKMWAGYVTLVHLKKRNLQLASSHLLLRTTRRGFHQLVENIASIKRVRKMKILSDANFARKALLKSVATLSAHARASRRRSSSLNLAQLFNTNKLGSKLFERWKLHTQGKIKLQKVSSRMFANKRINLQRDYVEKWQRFILAVQGEKKLYALVAGKVVKRRISEGLTIWRLTKIRNDELRQLLALLSTSLELRKLKDGMEGLRNNIRRGEMLDRKLAQFVDPLGKMKMAAKRKVFQQLVNCRLRANSLFTLAATHSSKLSLSKFFEFWISYTNRKIQGKEQLLTGIEHYEEKIKNRGLKRLREKSVLVLGTQRRNLAKGDKFCVDRQLNIALDAFAAFTASSVQKRKLSSILQIHLESLLSGLLDTTLNSWKLSTRLKVEARKQNQIATIYFAERTKMKVLRCWREIFLVLAERMRWEEQLSVRVQARSGERLALLFFARLKLRFAMSTNLKAAFRHFSSSLTLRMFALWSSNASLLISSRRCLRLALHFFSGRRFRAWRGE